MSGVLTPDRPNANYMTEDEAAQKWCFFCTTPSSFRETPAPTDHYLQTRCNASDCAAWRWDTTQGDLKVYGFCGLAGSPTLS